MKKFLAATLVVGALGTGTAAIAAINPLGVAGAQTSTPAPAPSATDRPIDAVLSGLVADGTLTQAQADTIKSRIGDFRKEHRPVRAAVKDSVGVAASTIGIDAKDLVKELRSGKSIAVVASEHGVAEQTVVDAVVADLSSKIDQAVTNGTITAERAATAKAKLPSKVTKLVEATRGHRGATTTPTTTG
jgi:ribosomal protein S20